MTDDAYERLARRNAELMEELADLMEENKRLRVRLEDTAQLLSGCIESYEGCWTQRANSAALDGAPSTTSLAHLKAQWRAEALETVAIEPVFRGLPRHHLRERASRIRRQAEEADTAGEGE